MAKTKNSAILVALKKLGPSYISKNTEIGKKECLSFFPQGYNNSSETGETTPVPVEVKPKKKKKKRQTKQDEENQTQSVTLTPADVEATDDPEDATEQDDDESADDDSTAGGNGTEELPETTET